MDRESVKEFYVKTVDGLYVACAVIKPVGEGPFPAVVFSHGAPGGKGMGSVVRASENPCTRRLVEDGYVFVRADWRRGFPNPGLPGEGYNAIDDTVSIVEYTKSLPYVDPLRIGLWGYSSGGAIVLETIGRTHVEAAVAGAPASFGILGLRGLPRERDDWLAAGRRYQELAEKISDEDVDHDKAFGIIERISCPLLIYHGSDDFLLKMNRKLFQLMKEVGKDPEIAIYEGEDHGSLSCSPTVGIGNKDALERVVSFFDRYLKKN